VCYLKKMITIQCTPVGKYHLLGRFVDPLLLVPAQLFASHPLITIAATNVRIQGRTGGPWVVIVAEYIVFDVCK